MSVFDISGRPAPRVPAADREACIGDGCLQLDACTDLDSHSDMHEKATDLLSHTFCLAPPLRRRHLPMLDVSGLVAPAGVIVAT
jgi:hypothetical protein